MTIRKESLGYKILMALKEVVKVENLEMFSYSAQMKYLLSLPHLSADTRKASLDEAVRRLRKKGFLKKEKNQEGEIILKLTQLGKDYLRMEEKWDGKYRIVIWDIPENKRRLRDLFRRKLREWEFVSYQKSVWVSKRNVTKKLRKLILELEMEKWVVVIESDDSTFSHINFHDRGL